MRCPACDHDNRATARFCEACGVRLVRPCPTCQQEVAPGFRGACPACGRDLDAGQAGGSAASPHRAALARHTPPHLVDKIMTSRSALEGERKQVTVLFADTKGSLELLADRDPEDARALLDGILAEAMDAVHRYEGTVNQLLGDGLMALFGAPLAHEDHALRACYAALRMQEQVGRFAERVRREEGVDVRIRVGLHSGEVVVRSIGSDLSLEYTAVGQTTHLAARMEQLARPGAVLITADTWRLVQGYVTVTPLGPVPVKGLAEPVEVFELSGANHIRSRLHSAAARGFSRLVGRHAELARLEGILERAAGGHCEVVAVGGEPGVGKSRLVWELAHSAPALGWRVLYGHAATYGRSRPWLPVIDSLRSYFQLDGRHDPATVRDKVTRQVLELDPALDDAIPALLALLGVLPPESSFEALAPAEKRRRVLGGIHRVVVRESRRQPLLLVFEDLQWIDSETQAALDGLVSAALPHPIVLVVTHRPEHVPGWQAYPFFTSIDLSPLPPPGADELLGELLGPDPALARLERDLRERTAGNPLFLEESVRALVETGLLVGERGAYRLARVPAPAAPLRLDQTHIPDTVQAILAARIDRLDPGDKDVLQSAAVIGRDVPLPLLAAVTEMPEDRLRPALDRLEAGEFLYVAGLYPDPEYTFKHALTCEVAYAGLLHERRRALHARVVETLEALAPGRLDDQVERLAHHALRGHVWDRAVRHLRRSAARAVGRSAHRDAVAFLALALEALAHLPATPATVEQAIDVRLEMRNSLVLLGDFGQIATHLRAARELAEGLGDQRRLCSVLAVLTNYLYWTGQHEEAVATGTRAREIADRLARLPLQVVTGMYLALAHVAVGDYRQAAAVRRRDLARLTGELATERFGLGVHPSVQGPAGLAWCLAELGEFEEARRFGEEATRAADRLEYPADVIIAAWGLGFVYLRLGEVEPAVRILDRGHAVSLEGQWPLTTPLLGAGAGYAHVLAGRPTEGLARLDAALAQGGALGLVFQRPLHLAWRAEGLLALERPAEARESAAAAVALARDHGEHGSAGWALRAAGLAALDPSRPDLAGAEAAFTEVLAVAEPRGMRPLAAHGRHGLARLAGARGDAAAGRQALARVLREYEELGMAYWARLAARDLVRPGAG